MIYDPYGHNPYDPLISRALWTMRYDSESDQRRYDELVKKSEQWRECERAKYLIEHQRKMRELFDVI